MDLNIPNSPNDQSTQSPPIFNPHEMYTSSNGSDSTVYATGFSDMYQNNNQNYYPSNTMNSQFQNDYNYQQNDTDIPPPIPPHHSVSTRHRKSFENSVGALHERTGAFTNRTPSPLRNAMDDVLHSLDNLELASSSSSPKKLSQHLSSSNNTSPMLHSSVSNHSMFLANISPNPESDNNDSAAKEAARATERLHFRTKSVPNNVFLPSDMNERNAELNADDVPFDPSSFSPKKNSDFGFGGKVDQSPVVDRNGTFKSFSSINASSVSTVRSENTMLTASSSSSASQFSSKVTSPNTQMGSFSDSVYSEVAVDLPSNDSRGSQEPRTVSSLSNTIKLKKSTGFLKKIFHSATQGISNHINQHDISKRSSSRATVSRPKSSIALSRKSTDADSYYNGHSLGPRKSQGSCKSIKSNRSFSGMSIRSSLKKATSRTFKLQGGRTASGSQETISKRNSALAMGRFGLNNEMFGIDFSDKNNEMDDEERRKWIEIGRNVYRTNTITDQERTQRVERQQFNSSTTSSISGAGALEPIEWLKRVKGNETVESDGSVYAINESHSLVAKELQSRNFTNVDNRIFNITSWPYVTPGDLAQGYIMQRYSNQLDQLRAAFNFCSTKIRWESSIGGFGDYDDDDDYQNDPEMGGYEGDPSTGLGIGYYANIMQSRRASPLRIACAFKQMCDVFQIPCQVVSGYLKGVGEIWENHGIPRPNHHWNAVLVNNNEWRIVDASLASPSFPSRHIYTRCDNRLPEFFYFLAQPINMIYTHIPQSIEQQHISPPISHEIAMALPLAGPAAFHFDLDLVNYNTALTKLVGLEVAELVVGFRSDVEVHAEIVAGNFPIGSAGTLNSSNILAQQQTKAALAQVFTEYDKVIGKEQRYYRVKALLPPGQRQGALNIYVGERGTLQTISKNILGLAYSIPVTHTGENPLYNFVIRHPTPYSKQDIYINEPQCRDLVLGHHYRFSILQQLVNNSTTTTIDQQQTSPKKSMELTRLKSNSSSYSNVLLGRTNSSVMGNQHHHYNNNHHNGHLVKMALQTPSGKILKLTRIEVLINGSGTYEGNIKCTEPGTWRGLILSDTGNAWSVFAEWSCS